MSGTDIPPSTVVVVDIPAKNPNEEQKEAKTPNEEQKEAKFDRKKAHSKTLDDLVNVNSLFTIAVFVGLTQAAPGARSLENRDECNAGPGVAKMLILYEVVAFACFLLSSLVAKVLKLILSMDGNGIVLFKIEPFKIVREGFDLKDGLLILTASASVSGIVLLTLSVVNLVQIRIGLYSCGSAEARRAIWATCTIVAIALIIYVLSIIAAIYASFIGDMPETKNPGTDSSKPDSKTEMSSAGTDSVQVPGLTQKKLDDLP